MPTHTHHNTSILGGELRHFYCFWCRHIPNGKHCHSATVYEVNGQPANECTPWRKREREQRWWDGRSGKSQTRSQSSRRWLTRDNAVGRLFPQAMTLTIDYSWDQIEGPFLQSHWMVQFKQQFTNSLREHQRVVRLRLEERYSLSRVSVWRNGLISGTCGKGLAIGEESEVGQFSHTIRTMATWRICAWDERIRGERNSSVNSFLRETKGTSKIKVKTKTIKSGSASKV